ncbi:MAG: hypothetical protein CH6_1461 [Candidatus Kapaibacterium sp.]|nr:MAG: hypothetical protein CH6_1461 [Candidatus Kapabacteria bacterium]
MPNWKGVLLRATLPNRQGLFFWRIMDRKEKKIFVFFAGLWALVEVSLGTILSLSKVPFRGLLMASFACFILIAFRMFVDKPRSSLYLASVVATIKLFFSLGAGAFNSALAIFIEGLLAEAIFGLAKVNLFSSILVGALVLLYPFLHSLFMQTMIFGVDIFKIYNKILVEFQQIVNLQTKFGIFEMILIFVFIYLIIGVVVGILSFYFSKNVLKKVIVNE